jgi:hypothetical protein
MFAVDAPRNTNLIALARQNDPFYRGSTGQVGKGRWFADLWQQLVLSLSKGSLQ